MRKVKVVLRKQDKLVISLPRVSETNRNDLVMALARIKIQNRRNRDQHHKQYLNDRHLRHTPMRHLLLTNHQQPSAQNWEQFGEDKAKMIEMHAF